jgi:hypothetical protein
MKKATNCTNQKQPRITRIARTLFLSLLAVFVLVAAQIGITGSASQREYSLVLTQVPFRAEIHAKPDGRFFFNGAAEKGNRIVVLAPDGSSTVLTAEFAAASDPSVSFDGKRILFAGKRAPQDKWDVWEMDIDGKNKQQITKNSGDCREPKYLPMSSITPPDFKDKVRWITFTSNAAGTYQEGSAVPATSLYATNLEPTPDRGFVTWRTTFNLPSDFSPTVLQDGRILFTSRQKYADNPEKYPLLAANWDGTGLNLFCGSGQGALLKTMPCEMPDHTLVFVESANLNDSGGQLARVYFRRPLHSYEALSRGSGRYLFPHPSPDGRLLVSYSSGKDSYGIYFFDFEKGVPSEKVFDDSKWEDIDAQPLVSRPEPTGLISAVVDALNWGQLHCLSVYDSDKPQVQQIKKGEVKKVRFVEGIPALAGGEKGPSKQNPVAGTRLIGEAPVEADGSFFVQVPADTPFIIQLLDDKGTVLQTMPRWMWVRRGTSRGCIGCHENKELAPENRVSDAVRRAEPHILWPNK